MSLPCYMQTAIDCYESKSTEFFELMFFEVSDTSGVEKYQNIIMLVPSAGKLLYSSRLVEIMFAVFGNIYNLHPVTRFQSLHCAPCFEWIEIYL